MAVRTNTPQNINGQNYPAGMLVVGLSSREEDQLAAGGGAERVNLPSVSGAGIAQQVSSHASGRASAPVSTFNGASSSGVLGKPSDITLPVLVDGKSRIKVRYMIRKTGTDAASYVQLHIGASNGLADPNVLSGSAGTQFASTTPYPALYELELHYKSGGFQITGNRFAAGIGQSPISWEFTGAFTNDGTSKLNIAVTGATSGNTYDLVFLDADIQVFQ